MLWTGVAVGYRGTVALQEGLEVFGTTVGLDRPLVVVALPVLVTILWTLVVRDGDDGAASRRARWALFATRVVLVCCLVVAAAGPYTVETRERPGDPTVTMLVDESASTGVSPSVADDLERDIEDRGVEVSRSTVATGNRSRIGDGVVANVRENGSLLLVSDGRVTGGRSLGRAGEVARRLNASVNVVAPSPNRSERYVTVSGPSTTSVGVENRFFVSVEGVEAGDRPAELVVRIDGTVVERTTVRGTGSVVVSHEFSSTGNHRVTATVDADDRYAVNDVSRKTVSVVSKPEVLYVSRDDYPLEGYLSELYEVTTRRSVPADLDPYTAVVLQDLSADEVGNVSTLQRFVLNGNGLVVAGGDDAFEKGNYSSSPLGAMVPVQSGDTDARRARIVLAIDVSGSTEEGLRLQKALALNVLDQLGPQNQVGVVAFDDRGYRVAPVAPLGESRSALRSKIRRLESGGSTSIAAGLRGAGELLDGPGTVILISDGVDRRDPPVRAARSLSERDVQVIAVEVGNETSPAVLRGIADASGGTVLRADQTNRLRIFFGDENRQFRGGSLTVVDDDHFVTAGARTTASLGFSNDVSVKRGATFLVATGNGDPAVSAWRYGVGRVVAITAYGSRGGLGGMLSRPDSLVVSRSVNWAIGDPRRKDDRSTSVPDTRVDRPTTVTYRGDSRPSVEGASFARAGNRRYEATITPDRRGYRRILDAEYAVNYRPEYAEFGPAPGLERLASSTGGRTFEPDEAGAIAETVARQTRHVREVRREWASPLLLAGLLLFLLEVAVRRVGRIRGTEGIP